MSAERWRPVIGFEHLYEVSDFGRVRSLPRKVGPSTVRKGRILKPADNGGGYQWVSLYRNGEKHKRYIHRVVAEAFVANPDGLPEVNHIDGDKTNNRADNVEWVTHAENQQHASNALGRFHKPKWYLRRFNEDEVREIRASPESNTDLAKKYGIDQSSISRIRDRKTYREIE